jgi:hypothetical protein
MQALSQLSYTPQHANDTTGGISKTEESSHLALTYSCEERNYA